MEVASTVVESKIKMSYAVAMREELQALLVKLASLATLQEKLALLGRQPRVQQFFIQRPCFAAWIISLDEINSYVLQSLIVIGQAEHVCAFEDQDYIFYLDDVEQIVTDLKVVEHFYDRIGGVIGYHCQVLQLLTACPKESLEEKFYPPKAIDLREDSIYIRQAILEGIKKQGKVAELYPVGGAADRLKLQDEKTHLDLPAARLEFLGHTLLAGMVRDVEAREYLHFKLYHKQRTTPIALMTSHEKNNHKLVQEIVKKAHYFHRPANTFKLFSQPLVPTFTEDGLWCLKEPRKLLLKPGGHGVVWKLAIEANVMQWLSAQACEKILVRQINNPIAGVDSGLISLIGIGCLERKSFGFASCVRRIKTSEGMNILKERKSRRGFQVALSNIEYCDFKKCGIEDISNHPEEPYSIFPSNTNILFADLKAVIKAVEEIPYPGALVNFKEIKHYHPHEGDKVSLVARLELLMQNIADAFEECFEHSVDDVMPVLQTFITFNERHKTISPTKKLFDLESGLVETALGCFYDCLKNSKELLERFCKFSVPNMPLEGEFLKKGPSFVFIYHPALGPLYSVIGQKIHDGVFAQGAELQLEVADVMIENLHIDGSLLVYANQVTGHLEKGKRRYSHKTGRCYLKNVRVSNLGIDKTAKNVFWKNSIQRQEKCEIRLEGWSEFVAENVVFQGEFSISVKDGERVVVSEDHGQLMITREKLTDTGPYWDYSIAQDHKISLQLSNKK